MVRVLLCDFCLYLVSVQGPVSSAGVHNLIEFLLSRLISIVLTSQEFLLKSPLVVHGHLQDLRVVQLGEVKVGVRDLGRVCGACVLHLLYLVN